MTSGRKLSLDDPESLRGAAVEEVIALIPDDWERRETRKEGGIRAFGLEPNVATMCASCRAIRKALTICTEARVLS